MQLVAEQGRALWRWFPVVVSSHALTTHRANAGFFNSMSPAEQASFEAGIIDVFPGCKLGLSLNDVRSMLAKYKDVSRIQLQEHYRLFLEAVVPVAAEAGVRLAVHPDDPPYSILGLPRIVSCESDIASILSMVDK